MTRIIPILLLFLLGSCKEKKATAPHKEESGQPFNVKDTAVHSPSKGTKMPVKAASKPRKKKRKGRGLPPPLRPKSGNVADLGDSPNRPCSVLVNQVCSLLSEGAEECSEARTRIRSRPATLNQDQCRETMLWYEQKLGKNRRLEPCELLIGVTCRVYGPHAPSCANAKVDWKAMRKPKVRKAMRPACSAELLLLKGLGR